MDKLQVNVKVTKNKLLNGSGVGPVLAKFPGGLPTTVSSNDAEFSLLMHRKGKSKILITEDTTNNILYYDNFVQNPKKICENIRPKHKQMIGIFDQDTNELELIPVYHTFNMKQIENTQNKRINKQKSKDSNLTEIFGTKYALSNMRKRQRNERTRNATMKALDEMDIAKIVDIKKQETDNNNNNNDNQIKSENGININNIFDYQSNDNYPLFLFECNKNKEIKKKKIYQMNKIIPTKLFDSVKKNMKYYWDLFVSSHNKEKKSIKLFEFVNTCMDAVKQVKTNIDEWKQILILYQITLEFYKNINYRPKYIKFEEWNKMKYGYLQPGSNIINNNKKRKIQMTKETKMRLIGLLCLYCLRVCMWGLSMNTVQTISDDVEIPKKIILGVFKILGCVEKKNKGKISLKEPWKSRGPGTDMNGNWWNVN